MCAFLDSWLRCSTRAAEEPFATQTISNQSLEFSHSANPGHVGATGSWLRKIRCTRSRNLRESCINLDCGTDCGDLVGQMLEFE